MLNFSTLIRARVQVLVCSDAFARGMDFADVQVGEGARVCMMKLRPPPMMGSPPHPTAAS